MNEKRFLLVLLWSTLAATQSIEAPCVYEPESRCFDESCGLPLDNQEIQEPCVCGESNVGSSFSACKDGSRSLSFFWRPPAFCRGGIDLPLPVTGIPCDLTCSSGTFLNVTTKNCDECQEGSYSAGDGHMWSEWHSFPGNFFTYCSKGSAVNPSIPCEQWELNGETIDSGDNHLLDYIVSNLELRIKLVKPGAVSFEYKVSAEEGFDALLFYIDDVQFVRKSNSVWTNFTTSLTAGFHTIKWQYTKDRSITRGEDKATIRSIRISGTTYAQTSCAQCPLGHFSNVTRADRCIPCPANTFSSHIGATSCEPCQNGATSFEGSSRCTPNNPCSNAPGSLDFSYYFTSCINNTRIKKYAWVDPPACNRNNISLPADEVLSCTPRPCRPGQHRDAALPDRCVSCPYGTYSTGGDSPCATCDAGQAPTQRVQHLRNWAEWESGISTGCDGENCFGSGWRKGYSWTDSGLRQGDASSSWIQFVTVLSPGSTVHLNYSVPCNIESNFLFSVNGSILATLPCDDTCTAPSKTFDWVVPFFFPEETTVALRWTYQQRSSENSLCTDNRAVIYEIEIGGVELPTANAGATGCAICPSGTTGNLTPKCVKCPAGSSSPTGSTQCVTCSEGTFADSPGTPACISCGAGTRSNSDKTKCIFDCSGISFPSGNTYNVASLGSWTASTQANDTGISYQLNGSLCDWNSDCRNAFVCMRGDELIRNRTVLNVGKVLSLEEITTDRRGVVFRYTGETGCTSEMHLHCEPSVDVGAVNFFRPFNPDQCSVSVSWHNKFGCPQCSAQDFAAMDSTCIAAPNGTSFIKRTFYQINPNCFGGMALPAPTYSPCKCQTNNGGCDPLSTCIDFYGGRNCSSCPAGYSGSGDTKCSPNCNPACTRGFCSFPNTCDCSNTFYSGKYCEIPICDPPCQNSGECGPTPNACDCTGTGYSGSNCEIPICSPPCANNGTCVAPNVCDCSQTQFIGVRCEMEMSIVTQGVSKGVVGVLVIVGLVVLAVAVAFLVVLYRRHQRLYAEYSKLASSNIPLEED